MVSSTVKERILVHLLSYYRYVSEDRVPYDISQPGIANAVGVSRPHISQEMGKLMKKDPGVIRGDIRRVKGITRKRKVYFLTPQGLQRAKKLVDRFSRMDVKIVTPQGEINIPLEEIGDHIKGDTPLLTALSRVNDDGVLDLTREEDIKEGIFIDREEEMEFLKRILRSVKNDGGKVLFIQGDPGIGKTRLVDEFGTRLSDKGFDFLSGRAYFESSDPYLPFKKVFDGLMKKHEIETPTIMSYHETKELKAEDRKTLDVKRTAAFFEITQELIEVASENPLVIFIDDLQWADAVSLQLIHYLAENLGDSTILLICAFRPQDIMANPLLKEICQRLRREGDYNELLLKPLTWKHTMEMIGGILGVRKIPLDFVKLLHGLSEGNPLFVKECVKGLQEGGDLNPKENRYPEDPNRINIPTIINDIIERRFDQLSDETKRLLHVGCVIGEEIPLELLLKCGGLDEMDTFDHADILLGTNIWEENPEEEVFTFSHALVHLAAYKSVPDFKRKHIHKTVAETMEAIYKDNIEKYHSDLANHFDNAGLKEKAISYYYKAGKHAEEVYAQEDALDMYLKGLRLWEEIGDPEGIRLLESLGDVNSILGDFSSCREYYNSILKETEDKTVVQRIYRKLSQSWLVQGEFTKSRELIDIGIDMGIGDDISELCKLYEVKGWALMQMGDLEGAKGMFEKERALSEEIGQEALMGNSNHNLGTLHIYKGLFEDAYRYLNEAIRIREKLGDRRGTAKSLNNIGMLYISRCEIQKAMDTYHKCYEIQKEMGDLDGMTGALANLATLQYVSDDMRSAEDNFNKTLQIFENIGDKRGVAMATNNLGLVYADIGDLDRAMAYQERALSLRQEMGDKQGIGVSLCMRAQVLIMRGELAEAEACLAEAVDIFREMGDKKGMGIVEGLQGDILVEKEEYQSAISHFVKSYEIFSEIGENLENMANCCRLGEAYTCIGESGKAKEFIDEGLEIARNVGTRHGEATCLRVEGMWLRERNMISESIEVFERVIDEFGISEKEPILARAYFELGVTYMEKGDVKEAEKYLGIARDKFKGMGIRSWKERVDTLLGDRDRTR